MSNRTLSILIIISLSFNLAFVAGFIYTRFAGPIIPPPHEPPMINPHQIMDNLKIDREQFRKLAENHRTAQMDFYRELSNENYDENLLDQKLTISLDSQRILDEEIGRSLIKLRSQMNPEDASRIFKKIYKNRRHRDLRPNNRQGEQK